MKKTSPSRAIRPSTNGRYNLNFIDWNNEWERLSEVELKIENGEELSDKEEEERVRSHMNKVMNSYGVGVEEFKLVSKVDTTKECYICLGNFSIKKKVRILPCKHMFCEPCLIPWIKSNTVCPTCKFILKDEDNENHEEF
jgi:hypothetical protein